MYKFSFHYPFYKASSGDHLDPCWMRVCVKYVRMGCKPTWRQMVDMEQVPRDGGANAKIAKAVFDGIRSLPKKELDRIDGKILRSYIFEIREEVDTRDLSRKLRALDAPKVIDFSDGDNLPAGTVVGSYNDMTIRSGDVFFDGETRFQVYGFRIASDSEDGRVILCVTKKGDMVELAPWILFETCKLETANADKDSLIVFDSKEEISA